MYKKNIKLTDEQVYEIENLLNTTNLKQSEIGEMFGISQVHVSEIKLRKTRKYLFRKC